MTSSTHCAVRDAIIEVVARRPRLNALELEELINESARRATEAAWTITDEMVWAICPHLRAMKKCRECLHTEPTPDAGMTKYVEDGEAKFMRFCRLDAEEALEAAKAVAMGGESRRALTERSHDILGGAEVIAGTRIPLSAIIHFAEDGYSPAEIVGEYPTLSEDDVRAAIKLGKARAAQGGGDA